VGRRGVVFTACACCYCGEWVSVCELWRVGGVWCPAVRVGAGSWEVMCGKDGRRHCT
jgi:hypothetical protein